MIPGKNLFRFEIDNQRFQATVAEGLNRLRKYLPRWFFTETAYQIAKEELQQRGREAGNDSRLAGN